MRTALSNRDLRAREGKDREPEKSETQSYTEQIIKYIPAEVVAFYIPALAAAIDLKSTTTGTATTSSVYGNVLWVIFSLAFLGMIIYGYKTAKKDLTDQKIDNVPQRSLLKTAISTLAFVIWAIYLGGPFVGIQGYATYGTLAILGFTFFTPAIYDAIPIPFKLPSYHRKPAQQTQPQQPSTQQPPAQQPEQ
jgi:hypothetical protein